MSHNPDCRLCPLSQEAFHNICVWGEGNPKAKVMLIGEAPGFEEDRLNRPFVGQAGQLLDYVLDRLGVKRGDLYITNVLKCRPRNNKLPPAKELKDCLDKCRTYLNAECRALKKTLKCIVVMGSTSLHSLTDCKLPITAVEGTVVMRLAPYVVAALHPAYVLRNPGSEAKLARALALAFKLAGVPIHPKGESIENIYPYEVRGLEE